MVPSPGDQGTVVTRKQCEPTGVNVIPLSVPCLSLPQGPALSHTGSGWGLGGQSWGSTQLLMAGPSAFSRGCRRQVLHTFREAPTPNCCSDPSLVCP